MKARSKHNNELNKLSVTSSRKILYLNINHQIFIQPQKHESQISAETLPPMEERIMKKAEKLLGISCLPRLCILTEWLLNLTDGLKQTIIALICNIMATGRDGRDKSSFGKRFKAARCYIKKGNRSIKVESVVGISVQSVQIKKWALQAELHFYGAQGCLEGAELK